MSLLELSNLHTSFDTDEGLVEAVNGIDLSVREGETVGIVGESGSGKSVTALSIMNLVESPGNITDGKIEFKGEDLTTTPEDRCRSLRGDEISMIFQDPMEGLNPVLTIGEQISETLRAQGEVPGEQIGWLEGSLLGNFVPQRSTQQRYPQSWQRAVDLMEEIGIPEPEQRADEYPHQFSGGMLQRAMIAQALAGEPDLLIADEPTTALDVTIQAQILDVLDKLQASHGTSILLITHDLGVIIEMCDRVAVMYAGEIVETAPVKTLFTDPKHPYTQGLLRSIPATTEAGELEPLEGQVPGLIDMPNACHFAPRCEHAHNACYEDDVPMYEVRSDHESRCVLYADENARSPPASPMSGTGDNGSGAADRSDSGPESRGGIDD